MKKNVLIYMFAALLAGATVTSCSNDDEPEKVVCPVESTTFSDTNGLVLTYSGQPMIGKQVQFTPNQEDGSKATLTLSGASVEMPSMPMGREVSNNPIAAPGVIPGETTTTIAVDLTIEGDKVTFKGIDEKNGRKLTYTGEVTSGSMKLDLQVEMPQNALSGTTWKLAGDPENLNENPEKPILPFHIIWTTEHKPNGQEQPMDMGYILRLVASMTPIEGVKMPVALYNVFQSVTFQPDGNIQAMYKDEMTDAEWKESPKNLAMYTVDESKKQVRVFLNVAQIAATASQESRTSVQEVIPQIMGQLTELLVSGIPVSYATLEDGSTAFYLDDEVLLPLLKIVAPLTADPELKAKILELVKANAGPMGDFAAIFVGQILDNFVGVVDKTTDIQLGIAMTKA